MTAHPRPPISAYIRAKNEARMIGETVRGALQVADEVIVVDSGSSDDTAAIAAAAGARILRHDWLGNGHQKRLAEDACRHDWLLDLDADEIVSPALAAEISGLFAAGAPPCKIYRTPMAIAPPTGEPWLTFGRVVRHKLYDRRAVRAPAHAAWDQFDLPAGEKIGALASPILHYAFTDAEHLMTKLNAYSSMLARELAPKPAGALIVRIIFGMPIYFCRRYFLNGLFRGGVDGFTFATMISVARWLRDVKMYERRMAERSGGKDGA